MWKYRCKSHLIALIVSFTIGFLYTLFIFLADSAGFVDTIITTYQSLAEYASMDLDDIVTFVSENPYILFIANGLMASGVVNIIYLAQFVVTQFNLSPIIIMILMFLAPNLLIEIGFVLVIPALFVCIYGVISLHRENQQAFGSQDDDEIVRIYKIHHKLDESVKLLADECKKAASKLTGLYLLGIVALIVLLVLVDNLWILTFVVLFYLYAFNLVLRYRANSFIPITKLLYEKCDPEKCASAIIYYSRKRNDHYKLVQHSLLAQCLIYLEDPELAQDVLIRLPRKDQASTLQYWSLMAYVDYMLKDEDALNLCKEEADKVRLNFGRAGVFIQSEEKLAIDNKINLMQGDLNGCKKYYLQKLQRAQFLFQKVDACYYIALISFVEEDYRIAKMYFEKVVNMGNKMYFVKKAKNYLDKINALDPVYEDDLSTETL